MSGPDNPDKKREGGLPPGEDFDWDNALEEWDEKAFAPEVARDEDTKKPATIVGGKPAPGRALYRPPTGGAPVLPVKPPPPKPALAKPALPGASAGPRLPPRPQPASPAPPQAPTPGPVPIVDLEEDDGDDVDTRVVPSPLSERMAEAAEEPDLLAAQGVVTVPTPEPGALTLPTPEPGSLTVPTPEPRAPGPRVLAVPTPAGRGAHKVVDRPGETFEANDDDVDALLGGPALVPRPQAVTRDFDVAEEPPRPLMPSAIDLQVSDVELVDPEPIPKEVVAAPEVRQHDPDAETSVGYLPPEVESQVDSRRQSAIASEAHSVEEKLVSTQPRGEGDPLASPMADVSIEEDLGTETASADTLGAALRVRADWLEEELDARSGVERARILLALSEIRAVLGERDQAAQLAADARNNAPELLLAHKQARALADPSPAQLAELLKNEANAAEAPEARLHAILLAADALREGGDDAGAVRVWSELVTAVPEDPRALVGRVAFGLAHEEIKPLLELASSIGHEADRVRQGLLAALALRGAVAEKLPRTEAFANVHANDALRRARAALGAHDIVTAAACLAELSEIPELARPAGWLFASLGSAEAATRREAAGMLEKLVADGEEAARRPLAARAIELSDTKLAEASLRTSSAQPGPASSAFSTADRAVIRTLLDFDVAGREADAEALSIAGPMAPLASAIAAVLPAKGDGPEWVDGRADRLAGTEDSRSEVRLARLLAGEAPEGAIQAAIDSFDELPESEGVTIELLARQERWGQVSETLQRWAPSAEQGHAGDGALAAGLVAERAGDAERARLAYQAARAEDPTNEGAARALVVFDPTTNLPEQLSGLADHLGDSVVGALARLEAVMRAEGVDDATRAGLLEQAHKAAPGLPMAAFLARRHARKNKDNADLLRWIDEERTADSDPLERAVDAVRQALLLEKTDPGAAAGRAEEAHRARPDDMALRELYERLAPDPPPDQGAWREQRAGRAVGDARAILYMEAAHRYELAGDKVSALRAAEAALAAGESKLARLALERAELEAGAAARLADELLTQAREAGTLEERREAYERLADLDAVGRNDPASALLWHRSILEESSTYKPSLRYLEHALISEGRDDELEPIAGGIARALDGAQGGEAAAHADLAARLRARGAAGSWDATLEVAEIGARQPVPSLSSQRLLNAHALSRHDDALLLKTTLALLAKTTRPAELSALLLRAGQAALRVGDLTQAAELLERAKTADPNDVVVWGLLADVRQRAGDPRGAAEACEALARTSLVPEHRLPAWYDAGRFWMDEVHDEDRGLYALEQAAEIDLTYEDTFKRLSSLYMARGAKSELASLLERRIDTITDPDERMNMEVERGRALSEVGDYTGARKALEAALASHPDSTPALAHFAELSAREQDWDAAEQAWVRLARLLTSPEEQREVYARLGQLYSINSVNLSRAELAFKEVLKRAPGDVATLEYLVDVYRRQSDAPHAAEIIQQLVLAAQNPAEKRARLIELAGIHESPGNDTRKAEQVLEGARREFPTDVTILRALAEFYIRHKQMPAVHILLDRAAADARRAFAAGRFAPALFEVMRAVFELRGRKDASRIVGATLAAFDGQPAIVRGAEARGLDPALDDKLAPEVLTPALRTLLQATGTALDAAAPVDLRSLSANPIGPSGAMVQGMINALAGAVGLPPPTLYVSAPLGRACVPASSDPPTLIIGEALLAVDDPIARAFMIVRAIKLILAKASALVRTPSADLAVLISAWLQAFNPNWTPQGVNPAALLAASKKVTPAMPKKLPSELGMLALEVAGSLGMRASTLGAMALAWANRAALLAVGDPNAALQAIAWSHGAPNGAPVNPEERVSWLARTHEAKDLMTFSISDAYAETRERLGIDKI
jgi:tetratricopeptide (TPR) repeat protein